MTDWLTVALACLVLAEPFLILYVAPRVTRRQVQPLFETEIEPRVRALLTEALRASPSQPVPPTKEELAELVRGELAALKPTPEALAAMQKQQEATFAAVAARFQAGVKQEIEAALDAMPEMPVAVEDAASVMSQKGVQARLSFAAREELFREAVQKAAGAPGLLALDELQDARPKVYKAYANLGIEGARRLHKEAAGMGIKLPTVEGEKETAMVGLL